MRSQQMRSREGVGSSPRPVSYLAGMLFAFATFEVSATVITTCL